MWNIDPFLDKHLRQLGNIWFVIHPRHAQWETYRLTWWATHSFTFVSFACRKDSDELYGPVHCHAEMSPLGNAYASLYRAALSFPLRITNCFFFYLFIFYYYFILFFYQTALNMHTTASPSVSFHHTIVLEYFHHFCRWQTCILVPVATRY